MTTQQQLSSAEIEGRLQALVAQRDNAQNIVVLQSGQIARLSQEFEAAQQALKEKDAELAAANEKLKTVSIQDEFHNRGTLGVSA